MKDTLAKLKYPVKSYNVDDLLDPTSKGFTKAVYNFVNFASKDKTVKPYTRNAKAVLLHDNYKEVLNHYLKR